MNGLHGLHGLYGLYGFKSWYADLLAPVRRVLVEADVPPAALACSGPDRWPGRPGRGGCCGAQSSA